MGATVTGDTWLRGELLDSRLAPDEKLPDAIRWIDLDQALLNAGAAMAPGEVTLAPDFVGMLWRWRLAGLRPLIATCAVDEGVDPDAVRTALLEIDVLTGGTLDAIRIVPSGLRAGESGRGPDTAASPRAADAAAVVRNERSLGPAAPQRAPLREFTRREGRRSAPGPLHSHRSGPHPRRPARTRRR